VAETWASQLQTLRTPCCSVTLGIRAHARNTGDAALLATANASYCRAHVLAPATTAYTYRTARRESAACCRGRRLTSLRGTQRSWGDLAWREDDLLRAADDWHEAPITRDIAVCARNRNRDGRAAQCAAVCGDVAHTPPSGSANVTAKFCTPRWGRGPSGDAGHRQAHVRRYILYTSVHFRKQLSRDGCDRKLYGPKVFR
jgi:hypothetical protein